METILIKCPHCGESMQAPAGRESIICMFCGKTIELTNAVAAPEGDIAEADKYLEEALDKMEHAFDNYRQMVKDFRKDTYYDLFEGYKKENYHFFIAIKRCLENLPGECLKEYGEKIAAGMISIQNAELDNTKRKNEKFSVQMDKNMFMVIYMLPSIKEIRSERADNLADQICEIWAGTYKESNISASDYEAIVGGFRRKLCYVTTAVCKGLGMGEKCRELMLIKVFRDGYLLSSADGPALVDEYYDIAPTIVKRMEREADPEAKYQWLWNTYIRPCVELIEKGEEEACKTTYCSMVEQLKNDYLKD